MFSYGIHTHNFVSWECYKIGFEYLCPMQMKAWNSSAPSRHHNCLQWPPFDHNTKESVYQSILLFHISSYKNPFFLFYHFVLNYPFSFRPPLQFLGFWNRILSLGRATPVLSLAKLGGSGGRKHRLWEGDSCPILFTFENIRFNFLNPIIFLRIVYKNAQTDRRIPYRIDCILFPSKNRNENNMANPLAQDWNIRISDKFDMFYRKTP